MRSFAVRRAASASPHSAASASIGTPAPAFGSSRPEIACPGAVVTRIIAAASLACSNVSAITAATCCPLKAMSRTSGR